MLLRDPGQRGHMLIEAMVGGAILAVTVATLFTGLTQSSSSTARALRSQQVLEYAQAQYDRLKDRSIDSLDWTVPVPPAPATVPCPDVWPPSTPVNPALIYMPNSKWRCTLTVTRQDDTMAQPPLVARPAYRTATITVSYGQDPAQPEITVQLELLKCERC
jgi:type II secretory pathway pseudopilin PulG